MKDNSLRDRKLKDVTIQEILGLTQKKTEKEAKTYPDKCGNLYRKISSPVTKFAVQHGLSPEFFTALFAICVISSAMLFYHQSYIASLLGVVVLFIGRNVFDYVDGSIAKTLHAFKGYKYTLYGKFNDYLVHYTLEPLVFISILYVSGHLIIGLVAMLCYLLVHLIRVEHDKLAVKKKVSSDDSGVVSRKTFLHFLFKVIFVYPIAVFDQVLLLGAIFGKIEVAALILAVIYIVRMPIFIAIFYLKLYRLDKPDVEHNKNI